MLARNRLLPLAYLALLGSSIALSVLAARNETLPGDAAIISWAQNRPFPGETFSDAMQVVTMTEVILGAGGVVAIALWLLGHRREATLLAIGLVILPILQWGLKELVDRPRPDEPLVELRAGFTSASFPAGHAMSAPYLYGFLLYLSFRSSLPLSERAPLGLWSAFVLLFAGPPSVWLGVHWPSDVLGGWAWALVLLMPLAYVLEVRR